MVQVTWKPQFITDSFFDFQNPEVAKIAAAYIETREAGRDDLIVELVSAKQHVRMSVYGENLRYLIQKFGDDTEAWIGKPLKVAQTVKDGKKRRIFNV